MCHDKDIYLRGLSCVHLLLEIISLWWNDDQQVLFQKKLYNNNKNVKKPSGEWDKGDWKDLFHFRF